MKTYLTLLVCLCLFLVASTGFATFGPPTPVPIDTTDPVRAPSLTPDELTVFLHVRNGPSGGADLVFATRPDKNSPFGAPVPLSSRNTNDYEWGPDISTDGLSLYYCHGSSYGHGDIWVATRANTSEAFSNPQPVAEVNTGYNEGPASISADGLSLFFSSGRPGGAGYGDLYMATRLDTNSPFGTPVNLSEINSVEGDNSPSISTDGLSLYYWVREMPSLGPQEIWAATRSDVSLPFNTPYNVEELNIDGIESHGPEISYDGKTIYFVSERDGSLPGELWMARVIRKPAFVTGGGWILPEDDGLNTHPDRRANFGLTVRLKKGLPRGTIKFFSPQSQIHLMSTSIERLVISGGRIAQFEGWARVNGQEGNWFFVEAIDNGEPGAGVDRFEIKIWSPVDDPHGDPTVRAGGVLQGGNIAVHVRKNNN